MVIGGDKSQSDKKKALPIIGTIFYRKQNNIVMYPKPRNIHNRMYIEN